MLDWLKRGADERCRAPASQEAVAAWLRSGRRHHQAGAYGEAERCYRRVLAAEPSQVEAVHLLGRLCAECERYEEAEQLLGQALRLRPDYVPAHRDLSRILLQRKDFDRAIGHLQQVLQLRPDDSWARHNLAVAMTAAAGRLERRSHDEPAAAQRLRGEALRQFQGALALEPGLADAAAGQARLAERAGDVDGALTAVSPFLDGTRVNPAVLCVYAQIAAQQGSIPEAIERLEKRIRQGELRRPERQRLLFSLGKLLDTSGEYERAFAAYEEANNLFPRRPAPDFSGVVERIVTAYEALARDALPRRAASSGLPVFIVGMGRSGTTLVEQILASHTAVHGGGELKYVPRLVQAMTLELGRGRSFPEWMTDLAPGAVDKFAQRYLTQLASLAPDAERITDKLPHNFLYLGLIELLFPDARVIHCRRDPIDTCLSLYVQPFEMQAMFTKHLESIGQCYVAYQSLMAYWANTLTLPMLEVRYEDLVDNSENVVRRIVDFCDLPWDERCLAFHEHARLVDTASYDQVRRPIYRRSVGRWRHYASHLTPLFEILGTP